MFGAATAAIAGILAVAIIVPPLRAKYKKKDATSWNPQNALYKVGQIHRSIPLDGQGSVQVVVNGQLREMKAITHDGVKIEAGADVMIEDYEDGLAIVSKTSV